MKKGKTKDMIIPETIEPDTTLQEDSRFIYIVIKLPDIPEEKIRIDIDPEKKAITIVASDASKIYKKMITLPVDTIFSNKRFYDGELHLAVEKKLS